jgi:hypothetical protein
MEDGPYPQFFVEQFDIPFTVERAIIPEVTIGRPKSGTGKIVNCVPVGKVYCFAVISVKMGLVQSLEIQGIPF